MTENRENSQENAVTLLYRFKNPNGLYVSTIDPRTGKKVAKIAHLTPNEARRIEGMGYQVEPVNAT